MQQVFKSYRYKVWIKQAEYDMSIARLSLENKYYEWACFQSEQAAEKAFKGLMVFCGYKPPKVHKLSILYKELRRLRPDLDKLSIKTDTLQAFTFISRYPFILPGEDTTPHDFISEEDAGECITEAEGILAYIKQIIYK